MDKNTIALIEHMYEVWEDDQNQYEAVIRDLRAEISNLEKELEARKPKTIQKLSELITKMKAVGYVPDNRPISDSNPTRIVFDEDTERLDDE